MIKYKHVVTRNNRNMYFKNGNMVGKGEIPKAVLNTLEPGVELEVSSGSEGSVPAQPAATTENQEEGQGSNGVQPLERPGGTIDPLTVDGKPKREAKSEKAKRTCIFCGEPATRSRFVNVTTVDLCDEDYTSHTIGELAAQVQKVSKK